MSAPLYRRTKASERKFVSGIAQTIAPVTMTAVLALEKKLCTATMASNAILIAQNKQGELLSIASEKKCVSLGSSKGNAGRPCRVFYDV